MIFFYYVLCLRPGYGVTGGASPTNVIVLSISMFGMVTTMITFGECLRQNHSNTYGIHKDDTATWGKQCERNVVLPREASKTVIM